MEKRSVLDNTRWASRRGKDDQTLPPYTFFYKGGETIKHGYPLKTEKNGVLDRARLYPSPNRLFLFGTNPANIGLKATHNL